MDEKEKKPPTTATAKAQWRISKIIFANEEKSFPW